ncbi:ABC transporter permease [Candidatus Kaiserbacteria bacterium]|nr:ABC transporter permease [Candidatus Kaiserbacteria bacterium]
MFSLTNIRVGWFLAVRQIRRASLWTTSLIVFVMLLTFLNLVIVTGILVGIVQGITDQFRLLETGDVYLSALATEDYIGNSQEILSLVRSLPEAEKIAYRTIAGGTLEANYQNRTDFSEKPNSTSASITGIEPVAENKFSGLAKYVAEGEYLSPGDYDAVLLGSQFVDRYSFGEMPTLTPLKNVYPGTKIRLTVNGSTRIVTVKGILVTTANSPLALKVFMLERELAQLAGRTDQNVDEIAIKLAPGADAEAFRDLLLRSGLGEDAKVQSFLDAIPNGIAEITNTFAAIGNAIGSVGLAVAAITIFIVIFINALTRRKFIGILKGIGISGEAIEFSYVCQSLFYAIIGSGIGFAILYGFLVPYISAHPISLPISNAILVAPVPDTLIRIAILTLTTIIAGYLPARMIVRKNTLDSILGRN